MLLEAPLGQYWCLLFAVLLLHHRGGRTCDTCCGCCALQKHITIAYRVQKLFSMRLFCYTCPCLPLWLIRAQIVDRVIVPGFLPCLSLICEIFYVIETFQGWKYKMRSSAILTRTLVNFEILTFMICALLFPGVKMTFSSFARIQPLASLSG